MIYKEDYDNGIRCRGVCEYGSKLGGCNDRDSCYQYYKENVDKDNNILLYKVVKFREKVFNCTIDVSNGTMTVYDVKYDNIVKYPLYSDNLVKECKDAVLRVYKINIGSEYVEDFMRWDGNMDK